MSNYSWEVCEDFSLPENSVVYGKDDDGSTIFCGKTICEGEELAAKLIPDKKECRVNFNGEERILPADENGSHKVLVCNKPSTELCRKESCNESNYSEDEDCEKKITTFKKTEQKSFVKNVRVSSCTTTVNKSKKGGDCCGTKEKCRDNCHEKPKYKIMTVPKITYEPVVKYEPRVRMEKKILTDTEAMRKRHCGKACCETCIDGFETTKDLENEKDKEFKENDYVNNFYEKLNLNREDSLSGASFNSYV